MMGRAAAQYADDIIITSDNPRTENPETIIDGIESGVHTNKPVSRITDRKAAIEYALSKAAPQDTVIIIGKGHEDYQILGTTKIHFDDREIVRSYYK